MNAAGNGSHHRKEIEGLVHRAVECVGSIKGV